MKFATILNAGSVAFGPVMSTPVGGDMLADVSAHFGSQAEALRLDRRAELDHVAATSPLVPLADRKSTRLNSSHT